MKPILFNTNMVKALLDGRKTVTRRVVKPQPFAEVKELYRKDNTDIWRTYGVDWWYEFRAPFIPGDILWVRETWARPSEPEIRRGASPDAYIYKADIPLLPCAYDSWRPSIHMPREAARIFLRVTEVRAERLQDIDDAGVLDEGLEIGDPFDELWDRTLKPADCALYGWAANPWVWVISFEQISKEEALKDGSTTD